MILASVNVIAGEFSSVAYLYRMCSQRRSADVLAIMKTMMRVPEP